MKNNNEVNGILLLNKPIGISSQTAVIKAKKLFNAKKAGHLGTLDPLACGVLPITFGKATRLFDYFLNKTKTYEAVFAFGFETETLDSEGEILNILNKNIKLDEIQSVLNSFIGEIEQLPPKYSAKNIDGKKAYDLAREGKDFEIKGREVNILNIQILDISLDGDKVKSVDLQVACSSGTYIRTLFSDIAKSINVDGHMSKLNRTQLANIGLDRAGTIEEFIEKPQNYFIDPIDVIGQMLPVYNLDDSEYYDVARGVGIKLKSDADTLALIKDGELKFIAKNINGIYKSQTNLE